MRLHKLIVPILGITLAPYASLLGIGLSDSQLRLTLQNSGHGVSLTSLRSIRDNWNWVTPPEQELFSLYFDSVGNASTSIGSREGWNSIIISHQSKNRVRLQFSNPSNLHLLGLSAELNIRIKDGLSYWKLRVMNTLSPKRMAAVFMPNFHVTPPSAASFALHIPNGSGVLKKGPYAQPFEYFAPYPSQNASYQLVGVTSQDSSLYLAAHDPTASFKYFMISGKGSSVSLGLAYENPWSDENKWNYETAGEMALGTHQGDWYEAAQIYRKWMMKETPWKPVHPNSMQDIDFWGLCGVEFQECSRLAKRAAGYLGTPMGLHLYNWHQIKMDTNFPHFFPERPGFREFVEDVQRSGVRVMPYINALSWDVGLEDFKNHAVQSSAKQKKGGPYLNTYGTESTFAFMCPTELLWKNTIVSIVSRLVREFRVSGVYLDQLALNGPVHCFDSTHQHELGGGSWWVRGYQEMLASIRNEIGWEALLTAEGVAEPYSAFLDGLLSWQNVQPDQVPIHGVIYGGLIHPFGRAYYANQEWLQSIRAKTAQAFVFGEQLGWLAVQLIKDDSDPLSRFIKSLVTLRRQHHSFIVHGEMLRPPEITTTVPGLTTEWGTGVAPFQWKVTIDGIQRAAWRNKKGEVLLVFINPTPETLAFEYKALNTHEAMALEADGIATRVLSRESQN